MNQRVKQVCSRLTASVLFAAMAVSLIPNISGNSDVFASEDKKKDISNTCLGTTGIASPADPQKDKLWSGSYVYYGIYGYPRDPDYPDKDDEIKFRVLDPLSDKYGNINGTVFLDSDKCLYEDYFDKDGEPNYVGHHVNEWLFSDLRERLNGEVFLDKPGVFTEEEKKAISESYSEWHPLVEGGSTDEPGKVCHFAAEYYVDYVSLNGEKIFILDAEELSNPDYGYTTTYRSWTRVKGPSTVDDHYWIRSAYGTGRNAGMVYGGGDEGTLGDNETYIPYAVCPAMNIDYSYVIFSSLIKGKFNEVGSEYKLTIKDDDLSIKVPSGKNATIEGTKVTIPYAVSGKNKANANRASVLILDTEYRGEDTKILYYDALGGNYSANGQGTFTLPSNLKLADWGSKYFVYILAEDINGTKQTDYASDPEFVEKPVVKTKYTVTVNTDGNSTVSTSVKQGYTGTKVTIKATPKDGYVFKKWQVVSGGVTLSSATKATATFNIGSKNVVIKAICEKNIELTLNKTETGIVCGSTETLKATLKGSTDKVTWKSSNTSIATVDSGKITAKQAGVVTITATAAGKTAKCKLTVLYKDVTDPNLFYYQPTYYLTEKGIVKGYDNQTLFKPANNCTRAQMVTFLWRLNGSPKPKTTKNPFKDVKESDYFYKAVLWSLENNITTGSSKTTFNPQGVCTRAQTVTFLYRMAGSPSVDSARCPFADIREKDYFYNAVIWAYKNKIVADSNDGTFKPMGTCLRRQMVTFLYKYDKYINGKG